MRLGWFYVVKKVVVGLRRRGFLGKCLKFYVGDDNLFKVWEKRNEGRKGFGIIEKIDCKK